MKSGRVGVALVLGGAVLGACGGAANDAPKGSTPKSPAAAPASPGQACLDAAQVEPGLPEGAPDRVGVAHVLVKYAGAKRAPEGITRSREEACLRAKEALEAMKKGTSFDDVVKTYSDEKGAATRGGSIGRIEPRDVAKPFAATAFALELNQVSPVVETAFGFHIILRNE